MTVEMLSDIKMKITLQAADLAKWNMTFDDLMQNEAQSKNMLQALLKDADPSLKFLNTADRLLIEMLLYKDFCVIYFTKTGDKSHGKRLKMKSGNLCAVFMFMSTDDMLCCFDKLGGDSSVCAKSSLYVYKCNYYLAATPHIGGSKRMRHMLSEFATSKCCQNERFYAEHGVLLCEDTALETLGKMLKSK